MRPFRHKLLILLLGSLAILAASIVMLLNWYIKDRDLAAVSMKAQKDLAACQEIIDAKYPGPWSVRNEELYKGEVKISLNNDLVDHLAQLTGDTVTLFLGDTRAATTVRGSNGERAIGTKAAANVAQIVLKNGQTYSGEADVVGQRYQTAYTPLRTGNGTIIGMFYVGISPVYEQEFVNKPLATMAGLVAALTILVGLIALVLLYKWVGYPLKEIFAGSRDVAAEHGNQKVSIFDSGEAEKIEDAFMQMVEQIQALTWEISRSTNNNIDNALLKSNANAVFEQIKANEQMSEQTYAYTAPAAFEPLPEMENPWWNRAESLPKGLNKATLDQIVQYLQATHRPISTEEVAEGVKLTRVTVRRYLEFLEQCGVLKSEQKCGTVGRPVKIFIPL
ncbi:cache domain-containing protein [Desulfosporosinus sp. PR]|uniref:cache domain-containing protein n=1 Tax=Candidatus Desulfosporosinus nitrosoreducens TaxID=3401928 RepID=UPI0027F168D2|nr:cache domain-containing protein [Desulfosporosinus sp. PR]MDQ7095376.1 cache domain-containing protein [Desulfosporosinus sp. PR]